MNSNNNNKLKTRKIKRSEAKKKKLEAFLALVEKDLSEPLHKKKKIGGTFEENYKALKDELRRFQKRKSPIPLFCLNDDGKQAIVNLTIDGVKSNSTDPLFVEDIRNLLLTSILGNLSPFPIGWAKIENVRNLSKTVFLEIENLPQCGITQLQSKLNENHCTFPFAVEILSSNTSFAYDLSTLHQVTDFYHQGKENYSSIFPILEKSNPETEMLSSKNNVSKLHLLLSPIQLVMENYPLPQSVFEQSKTEGYCFSKETYMPVSENSPMFAIDCEMCLTIAGKNEVTRIAIVNENLETIYHTLVKPQDVIINYMTKFSGVTEGMLQNVTTTLEDVQNDIRRILPCDAILCGQSLNCDLRALRMIHPYVIDTSVIYNEYGIRNKKTSLKTLARIHLKESIQNGKNGHSPVEDSVATMKLVLLKLKNFIEYGDAVLYDNSDDKNEDTKEVGGNNVSPGIEKPQSSLDINVPDSNSDNKSFFSIISRLSKKVCIIGSENSLNNYPQMVKNNTSIVTKSKPKKIIKAVKDSVNEHDLILSHIVLDQENYSSTDLIDEIKQLHSSFPNNTLFIIFISGDSDVSEKKFKRNYCMATIKTENTLQ